MSSNGNLKGKRSQQFNTSLHNENESLLNISTKTTAQHEIEVQAQRVFYIFDKALMKVQIVACLPLFLENNAEILREYLQPHEIQFIQEVCSKYIINDDEEEEEEDSNDSYELEYVQSESTFEEDVFDKNVKTDRPNIYEALMQEKRTAKLDPDMNKVIDCIYFNEPLRFKLDEFASTIDENAKTLVELFRCLKEASEKQLVMSAEEEKNYETQLKNAYRENKDALVEIKKLQDQLDKQRAELGQDIKEKHNMIDKSIREIETMKASFKDTIKKRVLESEKSMVEDTEISDLRQITLAEQAEKASNEYSLLLEHHLTEEKILIAKQNKVEAQLAQWLSKYDTDIGERQTTKEELTDEYETDKAQLEELRDLMADQEDLYDKLMAEKEEEEHQMFLKLAQEFCENRSARLIQNYWRAYKARKLARRKARRAKQKKGKKGKKKEAEQPVEIPLGPDPMAELEKKFKGDVLHGMKSDAEFKKEDVTVEL